MVVQQISWWAFFEQQMSVIAEPAYPPFLFSPPVCLLHVREAESVCLLRYRRSRSRRGVALGKIAGSAGATLRRVYYVKALEHFSPGSEGCI